MSQRAFKEGRRQLHHSLTVLSFLSDRRTKGDQSSTLLKYLLPEILSERRRFLFLFVYLYFFIGNVVLSKNVLTARCYGDASQAAL